MERKNKFWMIAAICLAALFLAESCFFIIFVAQSGGEDNNVNVIQPATIRGKVMNDLGEMLLANIVIESTDGKTVLKTTNVLSGYEIQLEEGNYILHYSRGMQYSTVTKKISVESFKNYYLEDIRLVRLYDAAAKNYYAGDLHQHTLFSDGSDTVEELARADIAAGLSWALLSDHNDNTGISEWMQTSRFIYDIKDGQYKYFTPIPGCEITTAYGHFQSIGSSAVVEQWEIELSLGENPIEEVKIITEEIVRNGGICQLNHPYSTGGMGFNSYDGEWDLIGNFNTIEIWNGYFETPGYITPNGELNQNRQSMLKWFELLNQGYRIFATSGTDLHSSEGSYNPNLYNESDPYSAYKKELKKTGQYAGMPTYFAYAAGEVTTEKILDAIENGHGFVTNGVLIFANVDGHVYGETAQAGDGNKTVNVELFCRDGLTKLNIYKNGEYVSQIDVSGTNYTGSIQLQGIEAGDWIVIEAYGESVYYAVTNPIFFD